MKKAVILAGGRGSRLTPLTDSVPKPLMPFLDRTVLEQILTTLSDFGITDVMISTMYQSDAIMSALGQTYQGISIKYLEETSPLGTAGGLVYARNLLSLTKGESLLVMSGDGICDFNVSEAYQAHEKAQADATIVTTECDCPLEYGIVLSDRDGHIRSFNEKPPWSQVNGSRVNTGIYILRESVIEKIPRRPYDFSKNLFPGMLREGMKLHEYQAEGYWCDIGTLESYYKCCMDAAAGRIRSVSRKGSLTKEELSAMGVAVEEPFFVTRGCTVERGSKIGPNTVIGSRCRIGKDCQITGSILHPGVTLSDGCHSEGAVIGEGCTLEQNCALYGGAVVAGGLTLPAGRVISQGETVTSTEAVSSPAKHFFSRINEHFNEETGLFLGSSDTLSADPCIKSGYALAKTVGGREKIGVMYEGTLARVYAELMLTGVDAAGGNAMDFGKGFEALSRYLAVLLNIDCFVFVTEEEKGVYAHLWNKNGLSPSHDFERRLMQQLRESEQLAIAPSPCRHDTLSSSEACYYNEIFDHAKAYVSTDFKGFSAAFVAEGSAASGEEVPPELLLLKKAFRALGGRILEKEEAEETSKPIVYYSRREGCAISQSNYRWDRYHMTAAILEKEKRLGTREFALPFLSPDYYAGLFDSTQTVYRYPLCSGKRFHLPRNLLKTQGYLTDDIFLAARMLSLLCGEGKNLSSLAGTMSPFVFSFRQIELPNGDIKAKIIRSYEHRDSSLHMQDEYEGITLTYPNGKVTIVPGRANSFRIYTEAMNSETAEALCHQTDEELAALIARETDSCSKSH